MTRPELKRFSEQNMDTGRAEQATEILFTDLLIQGAEIDSSGIVSSPYDPLDDGPKPEELEPGRITEITRKSSTGGRKHSCIFPKGSLGHLAATPTRTGSLNVSLVTVRDGIIFSAPLFNKPTLMQGLIAASRKAIEDRGIDPKNIMLAPTTIVKDALRNIGEFNGTEREVGERLMREYEAGRKNEWEGVHSRIDFSAIRRALSGKKG